MTLDQQGKTQLKLNSVETNNHHDIFGFKFDTKIETQRYVVSYNNNTYYIGFASNPGRSNNFKQAQFKQFLKGPDANTFVKTFDDSKTENANAFTEDMQIAAVASLFVYDNIRANQISVTKEEVEKNSATVYRTQGGAVPNASQERIIIGDNGKVDIEGDKMLYVTLDDKNHQIYFLEKRGGAQSGAYIASFEIPQSLADDIKNNAVPQEEGRLFPGLPQKVDPTKSNSAYGLPKEYIQKLRQQAIQGSGSTETP